MRISGKELLAICQESIEPWREKTQVFGLSAGQDETGYDISLKENITLEPGVMTLAVSAERVVIPKNIEADLKDKSTNARLGFQIYNTVIDAGFEGHITLEINNFSDSRKILLAGHPIASMKFTRLSEPVEGYKGKYQGQTGVPQEAITS